MPKESPASEISLAAIYRWFSETYNVLTLFAATGVGGLAARIMPFAWSTPTPWLLTASSIAGTVVAFRFVKIAYFSAYRRIWPSRVVLTPGGGLEALIVIHHYGLPTDMQVKARIVEVSGAVPGEVINAKPDPFRALWRRGREIGFMVRLGDDDFATVVLARTGRDLPGGKPGPFMLVFHDSGEIALGAENSGDPLSVLFEIEIASRPPLPNESQKWYYRVKKQQHHDMLVVEEVTTLR